MEGVYYVSYLKIFHKGHIFFIYAFLAKELVRLIRFLEILFSYIRST